MLTSKGMMLDYKSFLDKFGMDGIRKLKKLYTISTVGHNNVIHTTCAAKIYKQYIVLPRFSINTLRKLNMIDKIDIRLSYGLDRKFTNSTVTLTHNQDTVLNHLINTVYTKDNIDSGLGSSILQMDPGYGKTFLSIGLIRYVNKKTFIIVPNTYLLKQWITVLSEAFPGVVIGCFYGTKKKDGDIIVSIINSALLYTEYEDIGLVIYDEIHMYCSKTFSKIFSKAQSRICLGITATPNRLDKLEKLSYWNIGNVIEARSIPLWNNHSIKFTTSVTRVLYNGPPSHTQIIESKAGIVSVPLMLNQVQDDPYRNKMIVSYAIGLLNNNKNTFIFSDRRGHLETLSKLLMEFDINMDIPELKISKLMGGSTDADIETAKLSSKIILTTYQYTSIGVSIDKMDAIILATPRKSNMEQIIGRIFRLGGDSTITREVIDVVDNKICLKSQFYNRKKVYLKHVNTINDIRVDWDSLII